MAHMTQIAILIYPGFTALDAVGPYEVLSRLPNARVTFVARQPGLVHSDTGALVMRAEAAIDELPSPDVLVIPGGLLGSFAVAKDQKLVDWVRTAHQTAQWTTSVCTGALLLGAAGLLDGHSATTHWAARDRMARYEATYVPERLVRHGTVMTAAGVSAGIDMALVLAAELRGAPVAKAIQLLIEYAPQPPFTSGSLATSQPETVTLATGLLRKAAIRDASRRAWKTVRTALSRPQPLPTEPQ
ncbi:DJ-1/PfpI family protein [Phytoactinopolyspora endophytica]|uniref:DJ-1/PfpI family protein n=1 Tax=Phytoactinopolyspora endophytica TaxID=1642495 RepID=UPI00101C7EC9|nr:DJ-1/PfpI family protein [Phytoactinopolyspora endophytica]